MNPRVGAGDGNIAQSDGRREPLKSSKRQERRSWRHGCCQTKGADGNIGDRAPPDPTNDRGAIFETPGEEVSARCLLIAQIASRRDWVSR